MTRSADPGGRRLGSPGDSGGLALAACTALVSGVAVFVNSYGVRAIASPAVYTTAKNLVAFLGLAAVALGAGTWPTRPGIRGLHLLAPPSMGGHAETSPTGPGTWVGLAYVGVVGGGVAFVLFFTGLSQTAATPAAFWHDTLVVWVAFLALPLLGERVRWWNVAAIGLLVAGQIALAQGVGHLAVEGGQMLVLAATLLWSVEVVVAKWLLRRFSAAAVSLVRMGIGGVTLLVYLAATGKLHLLTAFGASQISWALVTGLLLAGYVGTWMTALARARAVDVSSVLVASVFVTALLQDAAGTAHVAPQVAGLVLVAVGAGLVLVMGMRRRTPAHAEVGQR